MTQQQISEHKSDNKVAKSNGSKGHASGDDVLEAMANEAIAPDKPATSFKHVVRDVAIVGALLAGGVYLYYTNVTTRQKVVEIAVKAADRLEKDDLAALKDAEQQYNDILALDADSDIGLAGLAETYFHQSRHGLDTRSKAEEYLRKAVAEGGDRPERYATDAYLKITGGQSEQVARELEALMQGGTYHPKLAHAWGWALLETGDYKGAAHKVRGALDTDFNAVRFALTMTEIAHRKGDDGLALRELGKVLSSQMNPDHEIATAWSAALRAKTTSNIGRVGQQIQTLQEKKDLGPVAQGYTAWAEGELAFALGNPQGALEKVEAASKLLPTFGPLFDLRARSLAASGKTKDAYEAYEAGLKLRPLYQGLRWGLARLQSEQKDNAALNTIAELEKLESGDKGPEFEIFRGEHYLRVGKLNDAREAFTRAAELGDDAAILLGLAKITFEEEKKKGNKADMDKVSDAFTLAYEKRSVYPELHEALGDVSLWNFQVDAAEKSYQDAAGHYKRMKKPLPEVFKFFDRVIANFEGSKEAQVKVAAAKAASEWKTEKKKYLESVMSEQ